ncbi:MAG: hypothetical protein R3F49_21910 [Planctomycetota bacterium]
MKPLKEAVAMPEDGALRLEYARALFALGDWSYTDVLIDALESEDVRARGSALKALKASTGETHGYHPQGTPSERAAAVQEWRNWWAERKADVHLAPVAQ